MSELKITDLKDARHPGEIAAGEVRNEVTAAMSAPQWSYGWQGGAQAVGFSGVVQQGSWPNAGARFMQHGIRANHRDAVAKHCVGVDATTRRMVAPSTDVMSDRPATETQQPGYRETNHEAPFVSLRCPWCTRIHFSLAEVSRGIGNNGCPCPMDTIVEGNPHSCVCGGGGGGCSSRTISIGSGGAGGGFS